MNAPEQLQMFEPTGREVLDLAARHERVCRRLLVLSQDLDLRGWQHASSSVLKAANDAERNAATMYMLAEFEALGGVA